jgi:Ca2+-binding RTX toxin-like protein
MGSYGFDTFCDLLKIRAGNSGAWETAGDDSDINLYGVFINSAYRQLCTQDNILGLKKRLYFPQLFTSTTSTTVDGTAYISDPSDVLYVTEVFDTTNSRKLDNISWKKYISYTDRTDTSSEGDPTEWVRRAGYIYLHKTPGTTGDTITVHYKKLVPDLSGSQTTLIGAEWDDVIIELAAYKLFLWTHDYDKVKFCKDSFLEQAMGLADVYNTEEVDRDSSMGPSIAYIGK